MSMGFSDAEDHEGAANVFDSALDVPDQDYTKRRRHKSINDARDRVPETLLEIERLLMSRQMSEAEAARASQRAVQTLAMELFWMFRQHPDGSDYLFDKHLGDLRFPRPNVGDNAEIVGGQFLGDLPRTPAEFPTVRFEGVESLLTGPDEIRAEWVVERSSHFGGSETERVQMRRPTPREVSRQAYLECVEFLGKADFGIVFDADRPLVKVQVEPTAETRPGVRPLSESHLFQTNMKLTHNANNDQLIVISAGSRTPVSGSGKTTLALTLAKALDSSPRGFVARDNATFSLEDLAYNKLGSVQEGSAIVYDEAQGTASGTGLNSRRGMKTETLDGINNILANRNKNLTVIIIFQRMKMMDTNLTGLIDDWLLIHKGVEERTGPMATHYEVVEDDFDWGNPSPKTPALEDIEWDALPDTDRDYARMEYEKEKTDRDSINEDENGEGDLENKDLSELPKPIRDEVIKFAAEAETESDIAEEMDLAQNSVNRIKRDQQ